MRTYKEIVKNYILICIYRSTTASGGVHNARIFNLNGGSIVRSLSGHNDNKEMVDICNEGTLNATIPVSCWVGNCSTISEGIFTGKVSNDSPGIISGGEFQGKVENWATISGGKFSIGEVQNVGHIEKGTFNVPVTNGGGAIYGGTFYDTVTNDRSIIEGGEFHSTVNNTGEIRGGTFYRTVTGSGRIKDGAYETVKFNSDNGAQAKEEKVLRGQKVAKPTDDPTKSGYTFTGWEDANGAGAYDFNTPVTAPLTLTAKWEKNPSSGGYYYYPTTDTKTDDTKGSPKTADPGAALYGALALLSLTGMVALNGKKR